MSKPQKIIFLDIDGAIIPFKMVIAFDMSAYDTRNIGDQITVRLISKMAEETGAKIVISSQHRLHGKERFLDQFVRFGFDPALLHEDWRTPNLGDRLDTEIQTWLQGHPEVTHWVAIDDEPLDTDSLLQTCMHNGFLLEHYVRGLNLLGMEYTGPKNAYWTAAVGFSGPKHIENLPDIQRAIERLRIPDRKP